MIVNTNEIIDVENYLFCTILSSSISTVKIKTMMSQYSVTNKLDYAFLTNQTTIQNVVQAISIFDQLNSFYNDKFLVNACASAFNQDTNASEYETCMKESIIQSANNTDSLLKLNDETVSNIEKDQEIKAAANVGVYNNLLLYNTTSFNELEEIFYRYISPVGYKLKNVISQSLKDFLNNKFVIIITMCACLLICMIVFSIWIGIFVVDRLIHLISISRCILKIIPTIVINNTPDLQNWIENKY